MHLSILYCLLNFLPSSFFDFKIFHNVATAEVDLFLRDDLKDLRFFLLKRFLVNGTVVGVVSVI